MKDTTKDPEPRTVRKLERGGDVRSRRASAEPTVWTERMLEALERGVNGGKWHSLYDKVYREKSLSVAWESVRQNGGTAGVDKESIEMFETRRKKRLARIEEQLREGTYEAMPVRRVWIPKGDGKLRPLGIPTIIDRVVQTSLRNAIEPIFERKFADCSYGFRPGRGCKDALAEVARELKSGRTWVVDVDIEQYFDTIEHERLMKEVAQEIADGSVLKLIEQYLEQEVMDGMKRWQPEKGTPQGAVISPLLANIYLHPVDVAMVGDGFKIIRYADDMVVMCATEEEATRALDRLRGLLNERGLRLHPIKTRLVDATTRPGFDFLGYRFFGNKRYPRPKSEKKLKDSIRAKTPRKNGNSMEETIKRVNATLHGWFGYFKHSSRSAFTKIDQWVRMRLRSILRRRSKRHGRGAGLDHFRWPNAYLQQLGLFNLSQAHQLLFRSSS